MDETLTAFVERMGPFPAGTVSVIGLGPGDAGLISVKGAVRMRQAQVAFHGMTYRSPAIWKLLDPDVEQVFVGRGVDGSKPGAVEVAALIRPQVEAGRRVVYLKNGDPTVFARADEEFEALAAVGIAIEVIPGPTSAVAAAAYAGVPITARGRIDAVCLAVGSRHGKPHIGLSELAALASGGTLAIYIAEDNLDGLCRELLTCGLQADTPAVIVEQATRPRQRTISGTVDSIAAQAADAGVGRPAIVFVGPRVGVRESLRWFERRLLFGQRILVTRPWHQSAVLAGGLSALGAEVIEAPTVAIEPPADQAAVDDALGRLGDYDWLILTSANGVDVVMTGLGRLGLDARALAAVRIAAIGPATAERLSALCVEPDLVPEEFVAEALAEALGATDLAGKRCLLLRSDIARKTLPEMLAEAGARCDDIPAYRTTMPDALPDEVVDDLERGSIQWATFTSSSTFENFITLLGARAASVLPSLKLASIGPITSRTIRAAGYEPTVEAPVYTVEGLADAIATFASTGA